MTMARETPAQLKKRTGRIIALLKKRYPDARCALDYTDPLELLVATILSAQCTDKRVNLVTKGLFARYKTAADYAAADPAAFQQEIRSTGFYRNKAKSILASAARLVSDFGGAVPDTMEGLLTLPGVARKTANVVLGNAFGKNEGIVVDTHVRRLAGRLKLSPHDDPVKIERDLMELVPRPQWTLFGHLLIFHGRGICFARKPDCAACPVNRLCPSAFKV
jgi:endonuclease-3